MTIRTIPTMAPALCLFIIFHLSLSGCRQKTEEIIADEALPQEVTTFSNGSLTLSAKANPAMTIYVETDQAGEFQDLLGNLEKKLSASGYEPVKKPSEAAYILHISILQGGPVKQDILESHVKTGYGVNSKFLGDGIYGLLADVLLVQRKVPESAKPANVRLQNISTRNALANAQMRIGMATSKKLADASDAVAFFGNRLTDEIAASITGTSPAAAPASRIDKGAN